MKIYEITPIFTKEIPSQLQEGIIYICEENTVAIHLCACGCKGETVTKLGGGNNWDLIKMGDKISLLGSIGNTKWPCASHYVITG